MGQVGRVGEPEFEQSTIQRSLGYAQVDAGALWHGDIHDDTTSCGVLLGPSHHGVAAGPIKGVCGERGVTDGEAEFQHIDE